MNIGLIEKYLEELSDDCNKKTNTYFVLYSISYIVYSSKLRTSIMFIRLNCQKRHL